MPVAIKITIGDVTLSAQLFDTECAKEIAAKLPIETIPNIWGDEFYFEIPVNMGLDKTATTKVKVGGLKKWDEKGVSP